MADAYFSQLPVQTTPTNADVIGIESSGVTNQITYQNLTKGKNVTTVSRSGGADYLCDGTADDVQINAATAAVNAAGGGVVFLRAGTYNLTAAIILYDNMTLVGEGEATKLFLVAGTNTSLVTNEHWAHAAAGDDYNVNINVYNLWVDGNNTNNTGSSNGGISIKGIIGTRIMNCTVENVKGFAGIYVSGATPDVGGDAFVENMVAYNRIRNCTAANQLIGSGIYGTAPTNHTLIIIGNYVEDCQGRQIFAEDFADTCQIIGNYVVGGGSTGEDSVAGIATGNSSGCIVQGNQVRDCYQYGIECGGERNQIIGNQVWNCGYSGIQSSSDNSIFANNVCYNNCQDSTGSGIALAAGATYNILTGNRCYDDQTPKTQTNGISEADNTADYNKIENNIVVGNLTNNIFPKGVNSSFRNNQGYSISCRAYASAAQNNLSSGGWTQLVLGTENFDDSGNFATNAFTAPVGGDYQVSAVASFQNGTAAGRVVVAIYLNDAGHVYASSPVATDGYAFVPISTTVRIPLGQTIKLYGNVVGNSTTDILTGSPSTFLSIKLL